MIKLAGELKNGDTFTAAGLPERCTVKQVATNGRRVTVTYAAKGNKKTHTFQDTDRVTMCDPPRANRQRPDPYSEQFRGLNRRFPSR